MLWDILLGLLFLGANKYGDYITDECPQVGYSCPKICDVDHKHLPLKECKNGKTKQESRSDATVVQSGEQFYTDTMAEN